MSVLNKKPFIQSVIEGLSSDNKTALLDAINGKKSIVQYSLVERNLSVSTPIESIQLWTNTTVYNGYKIAGLNKIVFLMYGKGQEMTIYEIPFPYYEKELKGKVRESLSVNELRRYLENGSGGAGSDITASNIDSESAYSGEVLTADGIGGAYWAPNEANGANIIRFENVNFDTLIESKTSAWTAALTVTQSDFEKMADTDTDCFVVLEVNSNDIVLQRAVVETNRIIFTMQHSNTSDIQDYSAVFTHITDSYAGTAIQSTMLEANEAGEDEYAYLHAITINGETYLVLNPTELDTVLEAYAKTIEIENGTIVAGKALTSKQLENVSDESGSYQTKPFTFQATGTDSNTSETSTAPVAKHLELRGQSYVLNQLVQLSDLSSTTTNDITYSRSNGVVRVSGTASADTILTIISSTAKADLVAGHSILLKWNLKGTLPDVTEAYTGNAVGIGSKDFSDKILVATQSDTYCQMIIKSGATVDFSIQPEFFDLTSMFGAGDEPSTVLEFNRLFPSHYQFNVGQLVSCQASKLTTVGYNQFNALDTFIKVVAGQEYTIEGITSGSVVEYDESQTQIDTHSITQTTDITLSDNTQYVKVLGTGSDICFHLTWDKSKTGYEAYDKHEYSLPNIELRSAGSAYDEIRADGSMTTRIMVVNLGELTWSYSAGTGDYANTFRANLPSNAKHAGYNIKPNMITSSKYNVVSLQANEYQGGTDNTITRRQSQLQIQDTSFGDDASALKASLSGKYAYIELETPIVSQVASFAENIVVDDFGTMEFNSTYPQGNSFFYPADYVLLIDDLNNYTDGDVSSLAKKSEIEGVFNVINATEIVSNTLTQEQYALITNGKPTLILGTLLSMLNPILFPCGIESFGEVRGKVFWTDSLVAKEAVYSINTTTKVIQKYVGESAKASDYECVRSINGKQIPAYPSSTGTFVLKCIDGTLTWVAE